MKRFVTISSKILMLTFMCLALGLTSCKKDDDSPSSSGGGSSSTPTYNLRFTCTSSNPYLVEINGTSNVLQGNTYKDYTLKQGTYSWKATQQSGYALYPTKRDGTVNLDQDKAISIP